VPGDVAQPLRASRLLAQPLQAVVAAERELSLQRPNRDFRDEQASFHPAPRSGWWLPVLLRRGKLQHSQAVASAGKVILTLATRQGRILILVSGAR